MLADPASRPHMAAPTAARRSKSRATVLATLAFMTGLLCRRPSLRRREQHAWPERGVVRRAGQYEPLYRLRNEHTMSHRRSVGGRDVAAAWGTAGTSSLAAPIQNLSTKVVLPVPGVPLPRYRRQMAADLRAGV